MTRIIAAFVSVLLLAGCSSVPLPGGAGGGGYEVEIEFADVLDLVEHASVKVDDVTVGSVTDITTRDWIAVVTVRIERDVELPANAVASLRQTSLLGEKFVDVAAPTAEPPTGRLADGDRIGLSRTDRGAEVEEVLSAAAFLLSGGGLEQLRIINTELVAAMEGREGELRDTLTQLEAFVSALDAQRDDIVATLEALDGLAVDLSEQREDIGDALDSIAPGVSVLADQREELTDALIAMRDLGDVGTQVIQEAGDDTVAVLQSLQPILEQLIAAGDDLPQGLEMAASYPFPPNVTETIYGDFVNLHITIDGDLTEVLSNLLGDRPTDPPSDGDGLAPEVPEVVDEATEGVEDLAGEVEAITGGLTELLWNGLAPQEVGE